MGADANGDGVVYDRNIDGDNSGVETVEDNGGQENE